MDRAILIKRNQLIIPETFGTEPLKILNGLKGKGIDGIYLWDRPLSLFRHIPVCTKENIAQELLCSTTGERNQYKMKEFLPASSNSVFKTIHQVIMFINTNYQRLNELILIENIVPIFPYLEFNQEYSIAYVDMYHGSNLLRFCNHLEFSEREYMIYPTDYHHMPIPKKFIMFLLDNINTY